MSSKEATATLEPTKVVALSTAAGVTPDVALAETLAAVPATPDFDITAIEVGLPPQAVADFRRAQLEGLRISKAKHEGEIISTWKLGQKIDQMMSIIELANEGKRGAAAAAHCARVFGVIEKTVTDYRRFAVLMPSKEQVMGILKHGPSWSVLRAFLQNDTEEKREAARKWMIRGDRFISSGDLMRIQDAARAKREGGEADVDMVEVSNAVFEARAEIIAEREKKKEDALSAKVGPVSGGISGGVEPAASAGTEVPGALRPDTDAEDKGGGGAAGGSGAGAPKSGKPKDASDLVSTGKLVKSLENQLADINGSLAVLVSRMFKVNGMDDDKAHQKLVNLVDDKLIGPLSQTKEQIIAIEKMMDDMKVKA